MSAGALLGQLMRWPPPLHSSPTRRQDAPHSVSGAARRDGRDRPLAPAPAAIPSSRPPPPPLPPCRLCGGQGRVVCADCAGAGVLGRGGYVKLNPLPKKAALVGSKWTAAGKDPVRGWRHFLVEEARKGAVPAPVVPAAAAAAVHREGEDGQTNESAAEAAEQGAQAAAAAAAAAPASPPPAAPAPAPAMFVRLRASCDPGVKFWMSAQLLRDRSRWAAGWLRMDDVVLLAAAAAAAAAEGGPGGGEEEGHDEQGSDATSKRRREKRPASASASASRIVVRGSGSGAPCRRCSGLGWRPCSGCRGEGSAALIVL